MKPLTIKSYPQKGVVKLRIPYQESMKKFDYTLFRR